MTNLLIIILSATLIIIIPKMSSAPKEVVVADEAAITEKEQVALDAYQVALASYQNGVANYSKAMSIINVWGVSGQWEDLINQARSPTIIKDGKEYLLATLPMARVKNQANVLAKAAGLTDSEIVVEINGDVDKWLSKHGYHYSNSGE